MKEKICSLRKKFLPQEASTVGKGSIKENDKSVIPKSASIRLIEYMITVGMDASDNRIFIIIV